MNANNLPAATRTDCSSHYGAEAGQTGLAHTTIAYVVFAGIVHRVVRFWRHDYLKTGKIEIYTLESFSAEYTSCTELGWYTYTQGDFFCYANESSPSKLDLAAMQAIAAADPTYTSAHLAQAARYAAMELA